MRVILQTQPYLDALVAGITTLTHLVQLQTPDLKDSTESSWARGLLSSRNPLLLEHPSGTMGWCPKAMASMMEGSLLGVETSLRWTVVSEGDKQKGELLQNMCARLLDMLSPPAGSVSKTCRFGNTSGCIAPLDIYTPTSRHRL